MFIDSHVNLHHEKFADDLPEVLARAAAAGVHAMLTISDKIVSTDAIRRISNAEASIWRSVGAHPHYAIEHQDLTTDLLVDLAAEPDVVGIGECGLDFHYNFSPREDQLIVFGKHIEASQRTGLPLIIHTREADDEMARILTERFRDAPFTPLLHCYTGGQKLADTVLDLGGYVSFSGIITFPNAASVRAVAAAVPMDRVIIETDCPYLAPVPKRGQRCEPAHLVYVASKLGEIKGLTTAEIGALTSENFLRLFGRAGTSREPEGAPQ